jgi:putative restriction endonuclease
MPAANPQVIVQSIIDAFEEGNASAILVSPGTRNPRQFIVQQSNRTFSAWIYIWTLTHGGGAARPVNEYRIQITGIQQPFLPRNPNGITLLMGYEPAIGSFAGFDVSKHLTFSTRSPSIQIPITTLHEALQNGLSFVRKGNDEIAIGIRPDQFLIYCLNAPLLHREGAVEGMPELLQRAAELQPMSPEQVAPLPEERVRIVQEVARYSRDSTCRKRVLSAYDKRCSVTRMQLHLVDAAHILPVGVEGSTDETSNGICLSPTYHRAFDKALIYLDEDLRMQINPDKERELIAAKIAGGLDEFKAYLGRRVHLPYERSQWPARDYIRAANQIRGIF